MKPKKRSLYWVFLIILISEFAWSGLETRVHLGNDDGLSQGNIDGKVIDNIHPVPSSTIWYSFTNIDVSFDGTLLAAGRQDFGKLYVWNMSTRAVILKLNSYINDVDFFPTGQSLVSTGYSGTKIWNLTSGDARLSINDSGIKVDVNADGSRFALMNMNEISVWDAITGAMLHVVNISNNQIRFLSFAFSPANKDLLAFACHVSDALMDSGIYVWNVSSESIINHYQGSSADFFGTGEITYNSNGSLLLFGYNYGMRLFNANFLTPLSTIKIANTLELHGSALSPDGCLAAAFQTNSSYGGDDRIWIWNVTSNSTRLASSPIFSMYPVWSAFNQLVFFPTGYLFAFSSESTNSGNVQIWNASSVAFVDGLNGLEGVGTNHTGIIKENRDDKWNNDEMAWFTVNTTRLLSEYLGTLEISLTSGNPYDISSAPSDRSYDLDLYLVEEYTPSSEFPNLKAIIDSSFGLGTEEFILIFPNKTRYFILVLSDSVYNPATMNYTLITNAELSAYVYNPPETLTVILIIVIVIIGASCLIIWLLLWRKRRGKLLGGDGKA